LEGVRRTGASDTRDEMQREREGATERMRERVRESSNGSLLREAQIPISSTLAEATSAIAIGGCSRRAHGTKNGVCGDGYAIAAFGARSSSALALQQRHLKLLLNPSIPPQPIKLQESLEYKHCSLLPSFERGRGRGGGCEDL